MKHGVHVMLHAFQWDLARQTERLDWLVAQLPRYASWGYQELYVHLEDAVAYPSLPGVARHDAYSWSDFESLIDAARREGIGVVPIVNLLGHTQYLIKTPAWRDLNELRAPDGSPLPHGQICPLHPGTTEVACRLMDDVAPFCTAGKVHVGLDESFHLGRHPLSRAEVAGVGLASHFARHVRRLHEVARDRGLRLALWADMLALLPEAIRQLPGDVIAHDWYYHAFRRHPRMELFNFAEYDLVPPLRARDIEYWGCPMNGAFRFDPLPVFGERLANARSWWRRCRETGAAGMLVTSWEPDRLAVELTTVVDAAIASLWLEPEIEDHPTMLARGFARVFGRSRSATRRRSIPRMARVSAAPEREMAHVALACDETAFAGYARWEMNERWDVVSTREGLARAGREQRLHARLARRPGLPPPLAASLAFRHYLAERDIFVRRAAKGVWRLRRLVTAPGRRRAKDTVQALLVRLSREAADFTDAIRAGRHAGRVMWRRTRAAGTASANERLVDADAARLAAWKRWLHRCRLRTAHVRAASPVAGAWQLQFTVINFAPAVQRVVIEQQDDGGTWRELRHRPTIEFRTAAARSRTNIRRELVAALLDPPTPVRVAVRGVGEVALGQIELTDGVRVLKPKGRAGARQVRLGRAAPRAGLPDVDPTRNIDELPLEFEGPR